MRQIGRLSNEIDARRFAAYLLQKDIDALVQHDGNGWLLWARNEDQLDVSRSEFEHFLANPSDSRYQQAEKKVEFEKQEPVGRRRRRRIPWRRLFGDPENRADAAVAMILIAIVVTLGSWLPTGSISDTFTRVLAFADQRDPIAAKDAFHDIKQGELWRVVTPIFLHYQLLHLVANSILFYYAGAQVERLRGPIALGLLILLVAVFSNSAQAYLAGADFAGLSGVAYGLMGYVWIKSNYEPGSGFVMHLSVLVFATMWFVLCLFVEKEHVPTYAQLSGLVTGLLIGLAPSRRDQPPTEGVV